MNWVKTGRNEEKTLVACSCWSQDCLVEAGDLPGHLGLEASVSELTGTPRTCLLSSLFYRWASEGTERKGLEHRRPGAVITSHALVLISNAAPRTSTSSSWISLLCPHSCHVNSQMRSGLL